MKKLSAALLLFLCLASAALGQVPQYFQPQIVSQGPINLTASAIGTTGSVAATLTGSSGKQTYICGFVVTSGGTTTAITGNVTVTGTVSGTMNFTYVFVSTGQGVLGFAVPNFGLALILIYVFSIKLDWLPITGIGSSEAAAGGWWTYIRPFIVPAVALGTLQTAMLTRLLRSSMIDVLSQDYMRTARAKGLLPATIVVVHALKNAMIPFVTMVAVQFGYMIGIQVTIEYIFAVPGMGSAVLNAVVTRDFPVIQGFTLVISAFFLFANIVADMLYALLDPRIRY